MLSSGRLCPVPDAYAQFRTPVPSSGHLHLFPDTYVGTGSDAYAQFQTTMPSSGLLCLVSDVYAQF